MSKAFTPQYTLFLQLSEEMDLHEFAELLLESIKEVGYEDAKLMRENAEDFAMDGYLDFGSKDPVIMEPQELPEDETDGEIKHTYVLCSNEPFRFQFINNLWKALESFAQEIYLSPNDYLCRAHVSTKMENGKSFLSAQVEVQNELTELQWAQQDLTLSVGFIKDVYDVLEHSTSDDEDINNLNTSLRDFMKHQLQGNSTL